MSKIIIKEVSLKNWGPFYKKHIIQFSTNPNQNVTYILGKNSTGKTKLFEAINCGLFKNKFQDYNLWEKANSEVKKEAELTNSLKQTRIEITFSLINEETGTENTYVVKRSFQYDKTLKKPQFFASRRNSIGDVEIVTEKEFDDMIDEVIPIGPREFYFLDGEVLVQLFKTHLEVVKDLTFKQSMIPLIDKMFEGLGARKKDIAKKLKTLTKKNESLNQWATALENQTNKLTEFQNEKRALEERIEKFTKKKSEIQKDLIGIDVGIKSKLEDIETKIEEKRSRLSELETKIRTLLQRSGTIMILEDIFKWCLKDLEIKKNENVIPSAITEDVITEILDFPSNKCLCEKEINDAIREKLEMFKHGIPKGDVNEKVIEFREWIKSKMETIEESKKDLTELIEDKKKTKIELDSLNGAKKTIKKTITDNNLQLIERLESINGKISERKIQINNKIQDIDDMQKEIKTSTKMIKKTQTELGNKLSKSLQDDLSDLQNEKEIVESLEQNLESIKEETITFIHDYIQEKTSNKYQKFIWNPKDWKGIEIDYSWNFYAIQKNDNLIISTELSKGQRHVLAISYMSSLPLITTVQLPFLFDSPFGGISEDPIEYIGKNLPEILKGSQLILFVTDTEHNSVYPHIKSKIGQSYTIHYKDNRANFLDIIDTAI